MHQSPMPNSMTDSMSPSATLWPESFSLTQRWRSTSLCSCRRASVKADGYPPISSPWKRIRNSRVSLLKIFDTYGDELCVAITSGLAKNSTLEKLSLNGMHLNGDDGSLPSTSLNQLFSVLCTAGANVVKSGGRKSASIVVGALKQSHNNNTNVVTKSI